MKVKISHLSSYHFASKVGLSNHIIRLYPGINILSQIEKQTIEINPGWAKIMKREDCYSNIIGEVTFAEKTNILEIKNTIELVIENVNSFDFLIEDYALKYPFNYNSDQSLILKPFLVKYSKDEELTNWLKQSITFEDQNSLNFIISLNKLVYEKIKYVKRLQPGVQDPLETIIDSKGSCRDSSWLLICCYRAANIAARFVSGYLVDLNFYSPEKDNVDLHAWVEVFLPGAGWLGLDPTTGLLTTSNYISLFKSATFENTAPIEGKTEPTDVDFNYFTKVERL